MEPLLKEPLLDFFSRLNVKERFANESLNKCVVCYWKAGEKIEASLSLSALEVVCKTTLQHSKQWKAQQQMTTCGTKHGGGQHVLWAPRPRGTAPGAELLGVAHPRSVQLAAAHLPGLAVDAGHTAECWGSLKAEGMGHGALGARSLSQAAALILC